MKKVLLLFVFFISVSFAQWSSNAAQNLAICDTSGEQALVKVSQIPGSDSVYISWFDNRGGSYAVYMQLIDVMGYKKWEPNGKLISNNPQSSSLVDYSLYADNQRKAVVTFTDTRLGGSISPFAYRYSPNGTMDWTVNLSNTSTVYQADPRVMQTSDGSYIFAWTYAQAPYKIALQKVSTTGTMLWNGGAPVLYQSSGSEQYQYQLLVPSDSGCVILVHCAATGSFPAQSQKIYAQKIGPNGEYKWGPAGVAVQSLGRIAAFTRPKAVTDGNGGVIISWHDDRDNNNLSSAFVQRLNSAGQPLFPVNGTECCLSLNNHFDPTAVYLKSTNEVMVFWNQRNSGQTQQGVSGQLISPSGARLWGDAGKDFVGLSQNSLVGPYGTGSDSAGYLCYYNGATTVDNQVVMALINRQGNYVWGSQTITMSTVSSEKIRIQFITDRYNVAKGFWQDRRNDGGGIYAQNITLTGALGLYAVPVEGSNIEVSRNAHGVTLQWDVLTEMNNRGFIIERQSANGERVQAGFVPGRGTTQQQHTYTFTDSHLAASTVYYRILQTDYDGTTTQFGRTVEVSPVITGFGLEQNYPNPFNPSTNFMFSVTEPGTVSLVLYDMLGNEVSTIFKGFKPAGLFTVQFNAGNLPGGVYTAVLTGGKARATRKIMLLK